MTHKEALALDNRKPCSCGYEERQKVKDAQWADRGLALSGDGLWPPIPNQHSQNCDSLDNYPLRPLTDKPACDKCGQSQIKTTFHKANWYYQPHHHDYWRKDLYIWACALTDWYRPVEHLDRLCTTCGFAWLEQTASAPVPA